MPAISSRDPLRVALIGYGHGGAVFHAPLIRATPGLELAAIVTTAPDRCQLLAACVGEAGKAGFGEAL